MAFDGDILRSQPRGNTYLDSFLTSNTKLTIMATDEKKLEMTDSDGHFRRKASQFRNFVSADPSAEFPAEKNRYVLYINLGCPW